MSRRRLGFAKAPVGDLPMLQSVRAAQTSAGIAMAQLAYQSADFRPQVLSSEKVVHVSSKINTETGLPWTVSDLTLHLFNKERDSLDPDLAADFNPDGPTLVNYLAGRKMPELERIQLAVARMIQGGTLPQEAFELVHDDLGMHRAVQPFKDLLLDLGFGQLPTKKQFALLDKKLKWLETGQRDFDRLLIADRTRFRSSKLELLDELLAVREHVTGRCVPPNKKFRKNLRWILRRAQALALAISKLRVATGDVVPKYSQQAFRKCLQFLPVMGAAGDFTFAPYLEVWLDGDRSEAEMAAFEFTRQQVRERWNIDIKPSGAGNSLDSENDARWILDTAMVRDFGDLLAIEFGNRLRHEVFIRRCIRWLGVDWTYNTALTRSICTYYEIDNRADSDLEEATVKILKSARALATADPSSVSLAAVNRLIKLVRWLTADVSTSLNLDVADAVPLNEQPWRLSGVGLGAA